MSIRLLGDIWAIAEEISIAPFQGSSSISIANLETPIISSEQLASPRMKAGPTIRGWSKSLEKTKEWREELQCLTLANNHTMDYGAIGLQETIRTCRNNGIKTIGAGKNLAVAEAPAIFDIADIRVGIISCCETQFGIAGLSRAGTAPFTSRIYQAIKCLKIQVDFVVVSVHGAAEMSPWPSPYWQDKLRSLVDVGANLIHGHHAHVPQGYEVYKHGLIFYGLGNFLVNPLKWEGQDNTLWSIVSNCPLSSNYSKHKNLESSAIGTSVISQSEGIICVRPSSKPELKSHLRYIEKCNAPLHDKVLLIGLWQEFSIWIYNEWYAKELGFYYKNRKIGHVLRNTLKDIKENLSNKKTMERNLLRYLFLTCESHREAITTALALYSEEIEDLRTPTTKKILHSTISSF